MNSSCRPNFFRVLARDGLDLSLKGRVALATTPLFTPEGFQQTFAELGEEIKNHISHRAKALSELVRRFPA